MNDAEMTPYDDNMCICSKSLAVSAASHLSGDIEESQLSCVVQSERHDGMIFLDSTTTTHISYIGLNIVVNCINRCTNIDGGVYVCRCDGHSTCHCQQDLVTLMT